MVVGNHLYQCSVIRLIITFRRCHYTASKAQLYSIVICTLYMGVLNTCQLRINRSLSLSFCILLSSRQLTNESNHTEGLDQTRSIE